MYHAFLVVTVKKCRNRYKFTDVTAKTDIRFLDYPVGPMSKLRAKRKWAIAKTEVDLLL